MLPKGNVRAAAAHWASLFTTEGMLQEDAGVWGSWCQRMLMLMQGHLLATTALGLLAA